MTFQLPTTERLKLSLFQHQTKLTTFCYYFLSAVSVHKLYQFLLSFSADDKIILSWLAFTRFNSIMRFTPLDK
ncbi:hypothetical protein SADUNF_Sadunf01G0034700 [Salix dunnii]|uniref:Uncharacterized protein n=1 Tax=Salix dunnii TaxID=1413687 RepID=A0A835NA80_9ROSI|nr:hypothetical protein SADUNF_Sadunf01G0034700 [Salix dunnii]